MYTLSRLDASNGVNLTCFGTHETKKQKLDRIQKTDVCAEPGRRTNKKAVTGTYLGCCTTSRLKLRFWE